LIYSTETFSSIIIKLITLNYATYSEEKRIRYYLPSRGEGSSSYTKYNTIMSDRAHGEESSLDVKANILDALLLSSMIKKEQVVW
jgi:hypothetical protein